MNEPSIQMIDEALLDLLLRGVHVDMQGRIARGAWPHPPLKLEDLVGRVALLIQREGSFPRLWTPAKPGEAVHEGGVVTREGGFRYVYRRQRHHPLDPRVLADSVETVFWSAEGAARHYLKWDLCLPGDLDGWTVEC